MAVQVIGDEGTVTAVETTYAVEVSSAVVVGGEPYEGAYEVTPSTSAQVLGTSGKLMGGDVTVAGITATATDADVLAGKSYFGAAGLSTGGMPDNGAVGGEIAARDASVAIPAGRTSGGSVSIARAAKASITPENIKEGVDILGVVGTFAGGGGGGGELLAEVPLGYVKSVNTDIKRLGVTVTVPDVSGYDVLVMVAARDSMPALSEISGNRHLFTATAYMLNGTSQIGTKNTANMSGGVSAKMLATGVVNSVYSSPPNGIRCGVPQFVGNSLEMPMVMLYHYNNCGIIDGDYTARVYGFNCLDMIGA